jgi:excinuclease ABC subunit C
MSQKSRTESEYKNKTFSKTELELKLKNLPQNCGIYQFLDKNKRIIYVGKAINLRNRVRSYFQQNLTSPKSKKISQKTIDVEVIVTDSEIEALILENNLIKKFKPSIMLILKTTKAILL